jgi:hypothetical protein
MTTDELQLLRDFRSDVPAPDEESVRQAYAYATGQPRAARRLRLRLPATNRARILGIAVAAGAAALIGIFAVGGTSPHESVIGSTNPHQVPTVEGSAPGGQFNPRPLDQALSTASKSFGVPIILPDTPVVKPSDAGSMAFLQWLPSPQPGVQEPVSQLSVQFPSANVGVTYEPTALTYWGSHYPNALDQYNAEIAQSTFPDQIVYLSDGTPALAFTSSTGNGIEFRLGKLSITIWSPNAVLQGGLKVPALDAATLQALAQSIVDQAATTNP